MPLSTSYLDLGARRAAVIVMIAIGALSAACQRTANSPPQAVRVVPQVSPLMPRRVTFSPTEQHRLLVVELTGLVTLWDIADPAKPELTTSFPANAIEAVFTPDGRSVLTAGVDGRVRAWSLDGRVHWASAEGHGARARAVAASADTVVSGGEEGALRFWRVADGAAVGGPVAAHDGPVLSLAMSSQGQVASVGADDALRLWTKGGSDGDWQQRVIFQGPRARPLSVFMNELRLDVHVGFDRSVAFSPKGDLIAAAVLDGAVRIYGVDGAPRAVVPSAHQRRNVRGIAFSPTGEVVASAGWDSTVRLWNLDGTPRQSVEAHFDSTFSVSFSANGDRLASAGLDNRVRFWSSTLLAAGELPEPRKDRVGAVALAPQSPIVAVADDAGTIRLWNLDGVARGKPFSGHKGRVLSLAFSPRGDQLASGGADRTFRLWGLDGIPRGTFPPHGDQVAAVAFAPNGDLVLSGSNELRGWRGNRVTFTIPLPGGWDYTTALAFTPRGDAIFTGSRLGRIQLLNADGSARTELLKLEREYIQALAISPDARIFATAGGQESIVRLWTADLQPLGSPLSGHVGAVRALAFSPNAGVLASGGDDGMVRLWKLPGGEAETLLVGVPVNQLGFWNELLWVRADGESIFFYDRTRQLVATTLLRRDAILTYTPDGWYAGPQGAERALRAFSVSGERLSETEILERSSPEQVRLALSK